MAAPTQASSSITSSRLGRPAAIAGSGKWFGPNTSMRDLVNS
jgi:hypothetical protein